MHHISILSLALFLAARAIAAPSPTWNPAPDPVLAARAAEDGPDCKSIEDYCTHCNGDFNCETDPRCEWCYENDGFGDDS
ncbi:hypothetical protein F4779DRAFT_556185 [Xylariaceae sp. FL0662B]|nr:hypothetical protein F4779DRAFT_556185 [Xylariaceae sp. FL0662B]